MEREGSKCIHPECDKTYQPDKDSSSFVSCSGSGEKPHAIIMMSTSYLNNKKPSEEKTEDK